ATGGAGSALGVIRELAARGEVEVLASETRPLLQGARLTVWELTRDGIPVTLAVDGAAAGLMRRGEIDAVIVGCDRVAANGDVAVRNPAFDVTPAELITAFVCERGVAQPPTAAAIAALLAR